MGLDFVEIVILTEERFKVSLDAASFEHLPGKKPSDLTASEFFEIVRTSPRHCTRCDYDLRGSAVGARCPECGEVPQTISWEAVQAIIAETMAIDAAQVRPESRLIKDLGIT